MKKKISHPMIYTTFYVKSLLFNRITLAASRLHRNRNMIIEMLLNLYMQEYQGEPRLYTPVRYQARLKQEIGRIEHLKLSGVAYEKAKDMVKLMKKSVSLMIAEAVEEYLDRLISLMLQGECNSYQSFSDYFCWGDRIHGWHIYHTNHPTINAP